MEKDITFAMYGLDVDKGDVDADVFARKFKNFLSGLHEANKAIDESRKCRYIITNLIHSSAKAKIKEVAGTQDLETNSSIDTYYNAIDAIYNGETDFEGCSIKLIEVIKHLTTGVGKKFSHAEIDRGKDNVIRIDDFLNKRITALEKFIRQKEEPAHLYKGIALATFDGILSEVDARGCVLKGIVTLTAGDIQIECTIKRNYIDAVRETFDKRANIEGIAHYDGMSHLPIRIDVRNLTPIKDNSTGLDKWKGAFKDTADPDYKDEFDW